MNTKSLPRIIAISTVLFALSSQAHDPKEHMQNAEQPDCPAMKNMDQSKMDMNDPVTQAMMQKCMKGMHDNDKTAHDTAHEDGESEGHTNDEESTENLHQ